VDRTCPDPPPGRPDYLPNRVADLIWPVPGAEAAEPHFWVGLPFQPGDEPTRRNDYFPYGYDANGRFLLHNGVDYAEPRGAPLLAVADGTVVTAGSDELELYGWRCNWYGQLVVVELDRRWHGLPVYALYGHVLNIRVAVGQRVAQGEPVAEVGLGGVATAAHLHFEVRVGSNEFGSTRNPLLWIAPQPGYGLIAGRILDPQGRPWQGVAISAIDRQGQNPFRTTWSYLDDARHLARPDEELAENFLFADLAPGSYQLYTRVQGIEYNAYVEVVAGQVTTVEIITEPYRTPTPTPTPTAEPTPLPGGEGTPTPEPTATG
jgi:hypothetical protein